MKKPAAKAQPKAIEVWTDWLGLAEPRQVGVLYAVPGRGKEVFYFEYEADWLTLTEAQDFDPQIGKFKGPQYATDAQSNFGAFLDASPDRWGRVLMKRREALAAREEGREPRQLVESDFLLGVHDQHRLGALRLKTKVSSAFLDDDANLASPPWTSLRELEHASLQLERDDVEQDPQFKQWLKMLIAPGGSLGGARPKASVIDHQGYLWIAKFPSTRDAVDVGAWEFVVNQLALKAGVEAAPGQALRFGRQERTFLSRRFDRTASGRRLHFASAMTLMQKSDGDDASTGASYLGLAEVLINDGADTEQDLKQLWRRVVFNIMTCNTDDHLRNHGFLLTDKGWKLSPAYDLNPNPDGQGLKLNISEDDNALDLGLARTVAPYFRIKAKEADLVIAEVKAAVNAWRAEASGVGLNNRAQDEMAAAFRVAAQK